MTNLNVLLRFLLHMCSLEFLAHSIFAMFASESDSAYVVHRPISTLITGGEMEEVFSISGGRWQPSKDPRMGLPTCEREKIMEDGNQEQQLISIVLVLVKGLEKAQVR